MQQTSTRHPRQFVLLGRGPWLRPHPALKRCIGLIFLVAVLTLVVTIVRMQRVPPVSDPGNILSTLFLGAGGLALVALLTLGGLWAQESERQYCPECLQFMRRGARVCPYCGLRDDQTSTSAAAAPARRPRLSA